MTQAASQRHVARASASSTERASDSNAAVFGADGLAFFGELSAVLLAVAEDGDKAAGAGQEAIDRPGGEDGAFAELARPMKAEDAGGVVGENRDLVRTQFH
jgi:hypothetical protein